MEDVNRVLRSILHRILLLLRALIRAVFVARSKTSSFVYRYGADWHGTDSACGLLDLRAVFNGTVFFYSSVNRHGADPFLGRSSYFVFFLIGIG